MIKEIEWKGEKLDELKERMHFHEHELIVKASAKVAQEIVEGRKRRPRDERSTVASIFQMHTNRASIRENMC